MAVVKHPRKKCEDCHVKTPSWGMVDRKKKMWLQSPGFSDDRQKRWCQEHSGDDSVCLLAHQKCEDCGEKQASFSMAPKKRRWCGDCKPIGSGTSNKKRACEDCGA